MRPEIRIVAHRYQESEGMVMVEAYVPTIWYGELVLVFLREEGAAEPKYLGLFVDCWRKGRFVGRASVIDELAHDYFDAIQYDLLDAVTTAADRAVGECWHPLGYPEWCWASNHGPQADLSAYRKAFAYALGRARRPRTYVRPV